MIHHYDAENKKLFIEYRHPGFPSVKKSKILMSTTKVRLAIFWNASGVLNTEFLTEGVTVNSDRYSAALRSFKQRIRRIRPERNVFLFHHYNARPYCSAQMQNAMGRLKITVAPQSPYSPDLAPSYFWLSSELKETLKGQRFLTAAEVQACVTPIPKFSFIYTHSNF
ncbi:UNVERIFIED_CONTAM: mariner\T [Trichonephila clavipes]